mgnify:FL=1
MVENIEQIIILIGAISVVSFILYLIFKSPFQYPYFEYYFDVSGKRKPDIENLIDNFLNKKNFKIIKRHKEKIEEWKMECQRKIEKSIIKKYRTKQYQKSLNDNIAYKFYLTREQTRYMQRNYVRTPYKVVQTVDSFSCDYNFLFNRNEQLKAINYECTLKEYNSKNQRKLMTKELRQQIIIRDKYTCQHCGKYMPDEVGIHVDHIVPISKGGKTVPSNLQVLCSKCNGSKSNK